MRTVFFSVLLHFQLIHSASLSNSITVDVLHSIPIYCVTFDAHCILFCIIVFAVDAQCIGQLSIMVDAQCTVHCTVSIMVDAQCTVHCACLNNG